MMERGATAVKPGSERCHEPLLRAINVNHSYHLRTREVLRVLDDVSLDVYYGEFMGIVGPSGCGKSTLLRILAGLIKPDGGHVLFRGRPLDSPTTRISMVFQTFALFPWYTVLQNVELALSSFHDMSAKEKRERAKSFLSLVGLSGFESAYPGELSGGMKQRAVIARALVTQPDVLLMDEPFSNLDPLTAISLRREVESMWVNVELPPSSVVLVSHDIEEVVELADRIVVLSPRPSKVIGSVEVDLPRPRARRSQEFYGYVDRVFTMIS